MKKMAKYTSNLSSKIIEFIEFKRSLGRKYINIDYYLSSVDRANLLLGNNDYLIEDVIDKALNELSSKCNTPDRSFFSYIREFSKYLYIIDNRSYVLNDKYKTKTYHAQIHLFTKEEISDFFKVLKHLSSQNTNSPRFIVVEAIFTFLYFCGVRCSEARLLKTEDVYLNENYIIIRNPKNHNDRKLFLTKELVEILKEYDEKISLLNMDRIFFFSQHKNKCHCSSFISHNFKYIWNEAGLDLNVKPRPRAYDFRHYFACANILKWLNEGKNVHAMLPYLMTYMGHSCIESTYYYIHLIPDFFPKYQELSSISNQLVPEVEQYEI